MFAPPIDVLLTELDRMLESREETREVIALASAAVLTASPHGAEVSWLKNIQQRMGSEPLGPGILLRNGSGPDVRLVDNSDGDARTEAVRYLLETLHEQHAGSAPKILERLSALAAEALSTARPDRVSAWQELLLRAHRSVQRGYLANNPDLN